MLRISRREQCIMEKTFFDVLFLFVVAVKDREAGLTLHIKVALNIQIKFFGNLRSRFGLQAETNRVEDAVARMDQPGVVLRTSRAAEEQMIFRPDLHFA